MHALIPQPRCAPQAAQAAVCCMHTSAHVPYVYPTPYCTVVVLLPWTPLAHLMWAMSTSRNAPTLSAISLKRL